MDYDVTLISFRLIDALLPHYSIYIHWFNVSTFSYSVLASLLLGFLCFGHSMGRGYVFGHLHDQCF